MAKPAYNYPGRALYYAMCADEFLRAYFVLGLNKIQLHARYFTMAHCLELSFKASLANRAIAIKYDSHDLNYLEAELVKHGNSDIIPYKPTTASRQVFQRMFAQKIVNFDMQEWLDYRDELEILLCYKHIASLKYGIDRFGNNLLAVTTPTRLVNKRFLGIVSCARKNFASTPQSSGIVGFVQDLESQFPDLFTGTSQYIQ